MEERIIKVTKYFKILLIIITFLLVGKLFWIAIIHHEGFVALSKNQLNIEYSVKAPRGTIYDCNGEVLVRDQEQNNLEYIESGIMTTSQKEELAKKIASLVNITDIDVNEVELQDFVLSKNGNLKKITKNLTAEEKEAVKKMTNKEYNDFLRSKLSQETIEEVKNQYTPQQLKIILLMNQATQKKSVVIKSNIDTQEFYNISACANQIGGFFIAKNYVREYPNGDLLRSFLGNYGSIPKDQLSAYEAQGYFADAKVGTSYVELELEPVLRSHNGLEKMSFDKNGNIIKSEILIEPKVGNNAFLTINKNLQSLVETNLISYLENNDYQYCKNVYASIVNPDNGNLLALGGKTKLANNEIVDYSIGNFTESYTLGSTIKPAILSLGYNKGIATRNMVVTDQPWILAGAPQKASHTVMGDITEQEAIARSSNIYFYTILLKLAGLSYHPNMSFTIDESKYSEVRNYLKEFGLGTTTGIGMQHETTGISGSANNPGLYLDLANGQFDTYTNLQQTQMAATIESLGNRYKINYLLKVEKPNYYQDQTKQLFSQTPQVLNQVEIKQEDAEYIRSLLDNSLNYPHSTVRGKGFKVKNRLSAKTGTSESFYYDVDTKQVVKTNTTSFIGTYQKGENKYSIGVVVPHFTNGGNTKKPQSGNIAANIFNTLEVNDV